MGQKAYVCLAAVCEGEGPASGRSCQRWVSLAIIVVQQGWRPLYLYLSATVWAMLFGSALKPELHSEGKSASLDSCTGRESPFARTTDTDKVTTFNACTHLDSSCWLISVATAARLSLYAVLTLCGSDAGRDREYLGE